MKTDLVIPVVPPSQDPTPAPAVGGRSSTAQDHTIAAAATLASAGNMASGTPSPALNQDGGSTRGDPAAQGMASQRVALSRTRLETMMLEAQAAFSAADGQRARTIARAVKMEAGAIRDALRSAAADALSDALIAATVASARAAEDAQEAARLAAARADDQPGLAPWSSGDAHRASTIAESAPLGTPTNTLHRSAFEALRRAQEILDLLGRIDGSDLSDAMSSGRSALLNRIEAEDGALLDGWNLLA